jgi:hypothetical protein
MTQRERNLAIVLGSAVVFLGGLFGIWLFWSALSAHSQTIDTLAQKVAESEGKIKKVNAEKPQLDRWRRLSLSADVGTARGDYRQYLVDLMRRTGVQLDHFPSNPPDTKSTIVHPGKSGKQPIWTGLNFNIRARAKLANFVTFLQEFQKTPKMHRIKNLTLERSDNAARKEAEMVNIQMMIEALIILDADQLQKRAGIPERRVLAAETSAALRQLPTGLALMGWSISPTGPIVAPLNPPLLSVRSYSDIGKKNFFMAIPLTAASSDKKPEQTPDDIINMMRFNRFIGLTNDAGRFEAKLWDSSTNGKARVKAAGGFNRIPLIQTGQFRFLVHGVVQKIEDREMIFRVTVNGAEPSNPKWWRYPDDGNFYRLDKEDLSAQVSAGKLRAQDRDKLYLVNRKFWENQVKRQKLDVSSDGSSFRFVVDGSRGDVVYRDREVLIVRMLGWPPTAPQEPGLGVSRIYVEEEAIYRVQKHHLDQLVAAHKARPEDEDRLYVIHTPYWDRLVDDRLVRTRDGSRGFVFYRDLVKGDVIAKDEELVVLRVADKYCYCPGDEELGIKARWHEGFCVLRIDRMVQDALLEPLPEERLKKFVKTVKSDE